MDVYTKDILKQNPKSNIEFKRDENGSGEGSQRETSYFVSFIKIVRMIKSRKLRWAGHAARMEEGMNAFHILTDKHIGKRPLGRPRRKRVDNTRMDLEGTDINTRNLIDSAQNRDWWNALVNEELNLRIP